MNATTTTTARDPIRLEPARGDQRFGEVPPDRPRLGSYEHPNLERPGARPHPACRDARRRAARSEHAST